MKIANLTSAYRAKLIAKSYKNWVKTECNILDIGCGTGVVADELRKYFKTRIEGCDIDSYLIRDIHFKKMTSYSKLPYKNRVFDTSMFNDVLHHTYYKNQKLLLKEALRVSKKVLIFELIPTFSGKIADLLINKMHNPKMDIPYTYRKPDEWLKTFKELGVKVETFNVKKPLFYPFTHIAFAIWK